MKKWMLLITLSIAFLRADESNVIQDSQAGTENNLQSTEKTPQSSEAPSTMMENNVPSQDNSSMMAPVAPSDNISFSGLCKQREYFIFSGEALFWMVTEEGLNYGVVLGPAANPSIGLNPSTGSTFPVQDYTAKYVNPNMNVGVRLNCTIPFTSTWDTAVIWTNYSNHKSSSSFAPIGDDQVVAPIYFNLSGDPNSQEGDISWKLIMNVVDIEFAKRFHPNPYFLIRTHIGARSAWMTQKWNTTYSSISFGTGTPASTSSLISQNTSNFQGYGLRFGLDNEWLIPYGFKVYANMAGSLLNAQFKTHQNESTGAGQKVIFLNNTQYDMSEVLELMLGIGWEKCWSTLKSFSIYVLWEENVWFHQNQLYYYSSTQVTGRGLPLQGNLGLSGPLLGLTFSF